MSEFLGFTSSIRAVILGASGGIGDAMARILLRSDRVESVWGTGRRTFDTSDFGSRFTHRSLDITSEPQVAALAEELRHVRPNLVVNCTGRLHTPDYGPERTWKHLDLDTMRSVFDVNTFGVALLIKHLIPTMPNRDRGVFASMSARVSSIGDNRLGGWYSYRASKTAQNMLLKTASLEARRGFPNLVIVGLHPGTVATELSSPFTKRLPKSHTVFSPQESAQHLLNVVSTLTTSESGNLYAWDGEAIPH